MYQEKFSLAWNDFKTNISTSLEILRREKEFFDVTLVSDDEVSISSHKVVLSACSPFFRNVLKRNQHQHPLLYLNGVKSTDLKNILDYVYRGEVQIFEDQIDSLSKAASNLKVAGLTNEIFNTSQDNMDKPVKQKSSMREEDIGKNIAESLYDELLIGDPKTTKQEIFQDNFQDTKVMVTNQNDIDSTVQSLMINDKTQCKVCGKVMGTKYQLSKHVQTHIEGLSYCCQLCNKTFRTSEALRVHNYRCPVLKNTKALSNDHQQLYMSA